MLAAAEAAGAEWSLLYGGRTRDSMAFTEELARYGDRVTVAPQDEAGLLGLPSVLDDVPDGTLVYCCGPGPLLDAVEARCPGGDILRVERFQPKVQVVCADSEFEVVLEQSGRTLTVPVGVSVLDTVRAAGVEVLFSCTEGTCGTCETDVLDGVPDHRDSVLSEEERAAGETMLICVSRCRGSGSCWISDPQVVVDQGHGGEELRQQVPSCGVDGAPARGHRDAHAGHHRAVPVPHRGGHRSYPFLKLRVHECVPLVPDSVKFPAQRAGWTPGLQFPGGRWARSTGPRRWRGRAVARPR